MMLEDRAAAAAHPELYHNIPESRSAVGADDPRTRHAVACFVARFTVWQMELVERIRRRLANDPSADVAFDRYLLSLVERGLDDLGTRP